MQRYRSENKIIWKSNKPQTNDQPITEAVNQRQNKKRGTQLNASEMRNHQQVRSSIFIEKGFSEDLQNNLLKNDAKNDKKQTFRLQINCIDQSCQKDDIMSVLSYGGYSVNSKFERPNKIIHNHRKINKDTVYDYIEGEIPYLEVIDSDDDQIENEEQVNKKKSSNRKKQWKKSPFAPLFYTKIDKLNYIERQTLHHQKRQKEIIQAHDKNLQKQIEDQKSKYTKSYSTYFAQRPLKQIKNTQSGNKEINKSQQNNSRCETNSVYEKGKIKTRQQSRKLNNEDLQMSKPAQPGNKHCYPCKIKFDYYKQHIESREHRLNVQRALGNSFFVEQMDRLKNMKKAEIYSEEYKMLEEFANYLQKIVESNDQYILKKHQQVKLNLKQINDQIQKWLRM